MRGSSQKLVRQACVFILIAGMCLLTAQSVYAKRKCTQTVTGAAYAMVRTPETGRTSDIKLEEFKESASVKKRCKRGGRERARKAACANAMSVLERTYAKSLKSMERKVCKAYANNKHEINKMITQLRIYCRHSGSKKWNKHKYIDLFHTKPFTCYKGHIKTKRKTTTSTWPAPKKK